MAALRRELMSTLCRHVRAWPAGAASNDMCKARCLPAPVFCMMRQVATYLNGFCNIESLLMTCSSISDVH